METGEAAQGRQAADLLAHQNYQQAKSRIEHGKPIATRHAPPLLKRLLKNPGGLDVVKGIIPN
jgi:hypothetical protein